MHGVDVYAVAGNPALHSLSPAIFRRAFDEANVAATYTRLAADSAREAMDVARAIGLCGFNVTSPFKEEIYDLVDERTAAAETIGAINTITFTDGKSKGFNVDGDGVMAMCASADFEPAGSRTAVLGAGGAARAAAHALKGAGADVVIVNRSEERGRSAADAIGCGFAQLGSAADELKGAQAVFACLPKSVDDFDHRMLSSDQIVFDANYGDSVFGRAAKKAGCRYVDGREWLLGQALSVYRIFTGADAPESIMREALEEESRESRDGGEHIIIAGMMGTGKSTVARELAKLMRLDSLDTDAIVETRSGKSITRIFEEFGETRFRSLEALAVADAISAPRSVIALGGGALTDPKIAEFARKSGTVVWLWAEPATCATRSSDDTRPLIAHGDPAETLRRILALRLPSYAGSSDLIVSTENRDAFATARKISDEIYKSGKY